MDGAEIAAILHDAQTLPRVQISNRDGFVSDPRPELFKSPAASTHVRRAMRLRSFSPFGGRRRRKKKDALYQYRTTGTALVPK
jgi:hypothetical protein